MTFKTERNIGIRAHRIEARAQESNPGRGWGGVELEKPDVILVPINCEKIKGGLYA